MLKDWCLEAEFNKLTAAHKLATDRRCKIEQEIIDVDQVDVRLVQTFENTRRYFKHAMRECF